MSCNKQNIVDISIVNKVKFKRNIFKPCFLWYCSVWRRCWTYFSHLFLEGQCKPCAPKHKEPGSVGHLFQPLYNERSRHTEGQVPNDMQVGGNWNTQTHIIRWRTFHTTTEYTNDVTAENTWPLLSSHLYQPEEDPAFVIMKIQTKFSCWSINTQPHYMLLYTEKCIHS